MQAQIKENIKDPCHWPLCREFTGDRWIPCTNGQQRGKCFHLMTSSCCKKVHVLLWSPPDVSVNNKFWRNTCVIRLKTLYTFRPRQNDRHFIDSNFICISMNFFPCVPLTIIQHWFGWGHYLNQWYHNMHIAFYFIVVSRNLPVAPFTNVD